MEKESKPKTKHLKLAMSFIVLIGVFFIFTVGALVGQSITLQEYDCRNPLAFQFYEYELRQCKSNLQNITIQYEIQKYLNNNSYDSILFYSKFYDKYSETMINLSDKYFDEKERNLGLEYKLALCSEGIDWRNY